MRLYISQKFSIDFCWLLFRLTCLDTFTLYPKLNIAEYKSTKPSSNENKLRG